MQNGNILFLAFYELTLSLVFSVLSVVLATKAMNRFVISLPVEQFIRLRHRSGCMISGGLIFSTVYLVRGSVEQSTLALQALLQAHHGIGLKPVGIALVYFVVFYLISFTVAFLAMFLLSKMYRFVTYDLDLDDEIEKKDNFALSIFLTFILLSMVFFIEKPISHVLGSLVFYDAIQKF